jgi:glutathione S-transferase
MIRSDAACRTEAGRAARSASNRTRSVLRKRGARLRRVHGQRIDLGRVNLMREAGRGMRWSYGVSSGRDWLVGSTPSFADFRVASFLPLNDFAKSPVWDYPNLLAWVDRLCTLESWCDPFVGLDAPPLPPVQLDPALEG